MNGVQLNGKPRSSKKPVPGCLGKMVNLFDLTSSANRLLTDKPYNDGSLSRSRSDVSRMSSVAINEMEDKVMVSELRRSPSNIKHNGTPVKMLIAQEMSKDLESKQKSPNVVAKLMGLDAIPQQQPDFPAQRIQSRLYTRNSHSEIPVGYWQNEQGFFSKKLDSEVNSHIGQNEYKDIYEIWQQSHRTTCKRDKSPSKARSNENINEKKLVLIRQKFMEAKRLATDEKLRNTKQFQDALDVLSSNGDLFLKVLQEPNSLISQQHYLEESIPPSPETQRITVLRPSKLVNDDKFGVPLAKRSEKQVKKQVPLNQVNPWENPHNVFPPTISSWKVNDSSIQPTRIVVLKPSPGKASEPKAVSSTPSSPWVLQSENFFEEPEDEEAREAREVAKEITQQMRENLAGHRRDETLLSSVLSNGYTGDESSFEKSEIELAPENLSDSEVMSPTSRHSWDYVNRYGSPFSSSSFSRASCSPESTVCREAKKRLSERWAMMASNGSNNNNNNHSNENLDQLHIRRSSSTLGEMLALSEVKTLEICEEEEGNKDEDPKGSPSGQNSYMGPRENGNNSFRNLSRSKSVPVSSTAYGDRLNVEVASPAPLNKEVSQEIVKPKASKTSFTGKVTSLLFSRNKKSRKEKPSKSPSNNESQLATAEVPGFSAPPARTSNDHLEAVLSPTSRSHGGTVLADLGDTKLVQGICSQQGFSVSQPGALQGENQEQPNLISVMESSFEEDDSALLGWSRGIMPSLHGEHMSRCLGKSNLIDKSPPIGSISRTLSWDESFAETTTNYHLNSPYVSPGVEDDEVEIEYLCLVQPLLTLAGLDNEGEVGPSLLARCFSLDNPLDPLLKDKFIDLSAKEPLHESKRRHLRSSRKLVFDCVNAALVDIMGVVPTTSSWAGPCMENSSGMALGDKVWAWMKNLLPGEFKYLSVDGGDNQCLVERLVRKEVLGKSWIEQIKLQVNSIAKEIEGKLLEELVEDYVAAWR